MSKRCLQPVAILWDIENCAIPKDVNAEDVAVHLRLALKVQLAIQGPIIMFSAYGDFSLLTRQTRQGCHKTGVNLIDVAHGKKDAADKAILVDMFLFALDYPPPCTVVLISGDVDFAPALHKLGQRGYSIVLAIPSGPNVSPALCNACEYLWSWPDVAHGKAINLVKSPSLGARKTSKPVQVAVKDEKPPKAVVLNAKNGFVYRTNGKAHSNDDTSEGVESNHLNVNPSSNQNGKETSRKIPEIPVVNSKTGHHSVDPLLTQSLNGVASRKFAPPSGQYVCDWFALPHPGNAHMSREEEGFWKKHVHQARGDFERSVVGKCDDASTAHVGPLLNMDHKLANRPAECSLLDVRELKNNSSSNASPYPAEPSVQGFPYESQKARKVPANPMHAMPACQPAAHVKSQGTPSQLKLKKKKMKKTKAHCVVEAVGLEVLEKEKKMVKKIVAQSKRLLSPPQKLSKKKKKKTEEHCVVEAAAVAAPPKMEKKVKEDCRLEAAPVANPKLLKKQKEGSEVSCSAITS